jgi:hypothetical protein
VLSKTNYYFNVFLLIGLMPIVINLKHRFKIGISGYSVSFLIKVEVFHILKDMLQLEPSC